LISNDGFHHIPILYDENISERFTIQTRMLFQFIKLLTLFTFAACSSTSTSGTSTSLLHVLSIFTPTLVLAFAPSPNRWIFESRMAQGTHNHIHNHNHNHHKHLYQPLFQSSPSPSSSDPDPEPEPDPDNESPEERAARMELVRHLQKSFYQNEDVILPPSRGSTIIKDLPLWRVQWTELPGFQNVLNVHVAHYTNMFQKILYSDSDPKYFGHIYLPGGSDNLDNPEYRMEVGGSNSSSKAALVGVLMQIADYKQLEDGRFVMIVQALERFRVVEVQRHHSPYAIATVEILPDTEVMEAFETEYYKCNMSEIHGMAVEEAFKSHPYEVRVITMDESTSMENGDSLSVSELSNYDANYKLQETNDNGNDSSTAAVAMYDIDMDDIVFDVEQKVWIRLDEMIRLLQKLVDPNNDQGVQVPTQILGLLPLEPNEPWPEEFTLEKYATKLEIEKILVGTFSKSPFVRVDNMQGYSPLRRAQRLSYVIWILTDTVMALIDDDSLTRQDILEMESTEERLEAALQKLDLICNVITEQNY